MNELLLEVEMILNCLPCSISCGTERFPESDTLTGADPEAQRL